MEYYDRKPTQENLYNTFCNDVLGRKREIVTFLKIIDIIDDNYTISLDAPWGSGKTFFVKQAKMILDGLNSAVSDNDDSANSTNLIKKIANRYTAETNNDWKVTQSHLAVYFDAWSYDDFEEPVLALIYSILEQLNLNDSDLTKINVDIKQLLSGIASMITGRNITALVESIKKQNFTSGVKSHNDVHDSIENFFNKILENKGTRCDIFIDELDRCNPKFAIKLFERIKHYFTSPHITFIFSTNIEELANTIRCQYGEKFDAERYLDRLFDLRLSLHKPADMNQYLQTLGDEKSSSNYEIIHDIISEFNFSLREINHYIQAVRIANGVNRNYSTTVIGSIIHDICVPIVMALKFWNYDEYNRFVAGGNEDLFTRYACRYPMKNVVRQITQKNDPNQDEIQNVFSQLYHTMFPIDNLIEYGYEGKKIGKLTVRYCDIDNLFQTVDILCGIPDINYVKRSESEAPSSDN